MTSVIEEFSHKINEINTRLEKVLRFFKIITGKWAIYVYGGLLFMIIFGFISDLANHTDWIPFFNGMEYEKKREDEMSSLFC